ncbi:prepilin peptidase [Trinickia fusca]|uniref:Peptidase A24 n=1 Tax=Trinickia fusca TaxID=2419777 RepID=A0A494XK70_9BURK|nr:prepilin peptidase [Trinickia fusca]RKP49046.1 peptidase A24 [Trinickia fusca]
MDWVRVAACWVLVMLAVSDLRSRRLSNFGVASFAALYFVDALLTGSAPFSLTVHTLTGGLSLALAALLFRLGWLGGGDAKLAAAVFLWSGPTLATQVFFIVSVSGLAIGLAVIACGVLARHHAPTADRLAWLAPARGVPYGIALAAGGAAAVWLPLIPASPLALHASLALELFARLA